MTEPPQKQSPAFLDRLRYAYNMRRKGVIALTGDVLDLFWCEEKKKYLPLDQTLYQAFCGKMTLLRVDISNGIDFFDDDDRKEIARVAELADATAKGPNKLGDILADIDTCQYQPIVTLKLLRDLADGFVRAARDEKAKVKPLCVILQYAGSMLPPGDFDRLADGDRQKLISFLEWISRPSNAFGDTLVILVADSTIELNDRVFAVPKVDQIEIDLPDTAERRQFVERQMSMHKEVQLADPVEVAASHTAGLKLTHIEDLFEVAKRTNTPLTRMSIMHDVNVVVGKQLGKIATVERPTTTTADIIGYEENTRILKRIFASCDNPDTAPAVVLIPGPNGGGKTFQVKCHTAEAGRVAITLTGLRSSDFGGTEKLTGLLRFYARTFDRITIIVDEAHLEFSNVLGRDTHEVEKRLTGAIFQMMSDPTLRGKVLWVLMSSRPDLLAPDMLSRASEQVPVFDLETTEDRRSFIDELFKRKKIQLADEVLTALVTKTASYSARAFDDLARKVRADGVSVDKVLEYWTASNSIADQRRFQSLIAATNCSYLKLLPKWVQDLQQAGSMQAEIERLRFELRY